MLAAIALFSLTAPLISAAPWYDDYGNFRQNDQAEVMSVPLNQRPQQYQWPHASQVNQAQAMSMPRGQNQYHQPRAQVMSMPRGQNQYHQPQAQAMSMPRSQNQYHQPQAQAMSMLRGQNQYYQPRAQAMSMPRGQSWYQQSRAQTMSMPRGQNHMIQNQQPHISQIDEAQTMYMPSDQSHRYPIAEVMYRPAGPYPQPYTPQFQSPMSQTQIQSQSRPDPRTEYEKSEMLQDLVSELQSLAAVEEPPTEGREIIDTQLLPPTLSEELPTVEEDIIVSLPPIYEEPDDDSEDKNGGENGNKKSRGLNVNIDLSTASNSESENKTTSPHDHHKYNIGVDVQLPNKTRQQEILSFFSKAFGNLFQKPQSYD